MISIFFAASISRTCLAMTVARGDGPAGTAAPRVGGTMKRIHLILGASLVALGALLPGSAPSQPPGEDLEHNRKLLEEWRRDPEKIARLQKSYALLRSLPADEQARLRRLDYELNDLDSVSQARLVRVMERYAEWMNRLPEADRSFIQSAPNARERLQRIQELKDRQYSDRQPRAKRLDLAESRDPGKTVALLKQEERQQRDEWKVASRHWDDLLQRRPLPSRLADFDRPPLKRLYDEMQWFVNE